MSLDDLAPEHCHVCGKEAVGERLFCRFYVERGRDSFCSPRCAELHLRSTASGGTAWVLAILSGEKRLDWDMP